MKKLVILLVLAMFSFACSGTPEMPDADAMADEAAKEAEAEQKKMEEDAANQAAEAMKLDIVDTAAANPDFATLVQAVTAAELAETLKGEGPFTVFAPTNDAFAALGEEKIAELMKPENKEQLATVLKFHVVPAKVMAADVTTMEADTAAGVKAAVNVAEDGTVTYAGAKVVKTDIECTNGVIHVIDAVVMPPEQVAAKAEAK